MNEIIFEVVEDEADGGYVAAALGHAIATQGETIEELRAMVRDAVNCHFGDGAAGAAPKSTRFVSGCVEVTGETPVTVGLCT